MEVVSSEDSLSVENSVITETKFKAFQEHYRNILRDMRLNQRLNEVAAEISNLLKLFQTCYADSERKTRKIRELLALRALEAQKVESVTPFHDENLQNIKDVVTKLQDELDTVSDQRQQLLKEIGDLKKDLDVEERVGTLCKRCSGGTKLPPAEASPGGQQRHVAAREEVWERDENSVLRANLDVLVADLKLTRKKISDLKRQVRDKDSIVKKCSRQISESETKLSKVQQAVSELRKPMEITIKTYKRELEQCKKKLHETRREFQKTVDINSRLGKDILSRDSVIESLTAKLKEMDLEKGSAVRKAELFEENLAASQAHNEDLNCEIKSLMREVEILKKETGLKEAGDSRPVDDREDEQEAPQENSVDHFKTQIALRDRKLSSVADELQETVDMLKTIRSDFSDVNDEKATLEEEVKRLKRMVKDRNCDLKELKVKLYHARQEVVDLKRDVQTQIIKNHQLSEKKNKIQSLYAHMKQENSQQKNEHGVLLKRQEYMVKILENKDKELKKMSNCKRSVS